MDGCITIDRPQLLAGRRPLAIRFISILTTTFCARCAARSMCCFIRLMRSRICTMATGATYKRIIGHCVVSMAGMIRASYPRTPPRLTERIPINNLPKVCACKGGAELCCTITVRLPTCQTVGIITYLARQDTDAGYNLAINLWIDRDSTLSGIPPRPDYKKEKYPTIRQVGER